MLTRREVLALSLAFLVTLPVVTARIYASDEVQYFSWLRSIVFDRDVDFDNEYRHFLPRVSIPGFYETFLADDKRNEAGRRLSFATLGSAVLWSPFYAVGHVAARMTGFPADGYSTPYVAAVAVGSACYGFAALLLSAACARRVTGRGLLPVLVVGIGTPLVFYAYVAPLFAHATSAFAVSLFLYVWLQVRERWSWRGAALLGLAGGLMAMVREQDVFFVAGPALDFATWAVGARRSAPGTGTAEPPRAQSPGPRAISEAALAGVAAFLLAFAPQLLAYKALNGHFGPTTYVARKMSWHSPHAAGVVLSPEHGLFFWTPLVLVALAGLVWLASGRVARDRRDAQWIGLLAIVMFGLQVYVNGAVESWSAAGAFGHRRFVATTPILAIGIAAVLAAATARRVRVALGMLVAVCLWWNLGLMVLFGTHRMDRTRLTLAENARAVFLELPLEAPGLAWRYLTDRGSFYQQPRQ